MLEKTKLHLGSIMGLYNEAGTMEQEYSYNAWGKRRTVDTWNANVSIPGDLLLTTRGYTSHEHLDRVNLINMNGRLYDPLTARMLSPDPFVQNASSTQNYNRYSYCMNNPLKYTDPSGYYYFYDFNGRQDSKDVFAWIDIADGHEGDNISAGALGYTYQDGKYMDKATGEIVNFNEVYSYLIDNALKENPGNVKTVDPQYYNDLKNGYKLFSFKIFNRTELVLSNGTPELTGSNKLGYYLNTTAGTIPLNQYFHINDLVDFGAIDRDWLDKTQITLGAFAIAHGLKEELITFAAKADPTIKSLKYYKAVKAGGVALNVVGLGFTGYDIYQNGLNTSNGVDFVMGCVAFVPGWGWAVSGAYFLGKLGYEYYFTEP